MNKPLLSIVIANYNYGHFLGEAILSVIKQVGFDRCELIVVDGGSTDNSVEIIKKYEDKIAWWVSEKDKGQSDAFNKGFAHAKGKYLTWLNADDLLMPDCLSKLCFYLENNPNEEWVSASTVYVTPKNEIVTTGLKMLNPITRLLFVPAWIGIAAPSTIFSKKLYDKAGGIDESLHYVMDTELWMRFGELGAKLRYLNFDMWIFRLHEMSKTSSSITAGVRSDGFLKERILIRKKHNVNKFKDRKSVFLKRLACIISLSYIRRFLFLRRNKGKNVFQVLSHSI